MTKIKLPLKQITDIPMDGEPHRLGHMTKGIRYENGDWSVSHYSALIIYYMKGCGLITLDGGGYRSETTEGRLNFYLKSKGIEITSQDNMWTVNFNNDSTLFYDGLVVGGPDNFDLNGCVFDITIIRKRDKLLQYLESEIKEYDVLPEKFGYDICELLEYPNTKLAVETLDHAYILKEFKKLCHTRLPDIAEFITNS